VCVWLTGLSGAGKTTLSHHLSDALQQIEREHIVLDGDALRALTPGLGFTRSDRDKHVAMVAARAKHAVDDGAVAVCALISPYRAARAEARALIGTDRFLEVFVSTPVEVCERRDPKGLYRRYRRGEVVGLTGLDAPYEAPAAADLVIRTDDGLPEDHVEHITGLLRERGFI
jgi:sulfate adenylyltransferase